MKHKKITVEEAMKIIESGRPLGTFYTEENGIFTAIDNINGHVWTEDFKNKEDCIKYLDESNPSAWQTWSDC